MRSFSKEESSADQYREAINKRCGDSLTAGAGWAERRFRSPMSDLCMCALAPIGRSFQIGRKIAFMYGAFNGLIGFVPQAAIALVLWYGGTLVVDGMLQTGQLTSFLLYTLSVAMVRWRVPAAAVDSGAPKWTRGSGGSGVVGGRRRSPSCRACLATLCRPLAPPSASSSSSIASRPSTPKGAQRLAVLAARRCRGNHPTGSGVLRGRRRSSGRRLPDFKGQVTFRDVSFVYPTR